jgi:hypothetical protein
MMMKVSRSSNVLAAMLITTAKILTRAKCLIVFEGIRTKSPDRCWAIQATKQIAESRKQAAVR